MMEGPSADSGEKREPVGNIDIAVVDSLKVLDPRRPIRKGDNVMAGLVPAIHALVSRKTWMPGMKPGMTVDRLFEISPCGTFTS